MSKPSTEVARNEAWAVLARVRGENATVRLNFASHLLTQMQVEPDYVGWFDVACISPEMILRVAAEVSR